MSGLSPEEMRRYGRHLILPEVGLAGQKRLAAARVLLVGAGGLGSPSAMYLAAAGVGTLGLIDDDRVEESNLQRQVLYGQSDVGRPKIEAATERLGEINPHIRIEAHGERLVRGNVEALVADYDLVVDGSDNFVTRYLINDACVIAGKPDVWGAVSRFEGQVSIFGVPGGACYRCLFPEPPPPGLVPSCAEGGILGVLPGIMGALQANEAVKWILGLGESLVGRLVIFDALRFRFRELSLAANGSCPLCGEEPAKRRIIETHQRVCAGPDSASPNDSEETSTVFKDQGDLPFEIDVAMLKSWLDEGRELTLVDVREPHEHELCQIPGNLLIPLRQIPERAEELDPKALTVVHCHHGARSAQAVMYLRQQGFEQVTNLGGGIDAWSAVIDPSVPRY